MKFSHPDADVFVPDARPPEIALAGVTHLCIAAHQDDIEIMAHAGICDCLETPGKGFGGVIVTDGAGSPRSGPYAHFSDEQIRATRRTEQRRAAALGRYTIQLQLAHPSAVVKNPGAAAALRADLVAIFSACTPEIVYLHNPADKHDTHIAVLHRCLEALHALPRENRPARVLGCEVWRDLDWLPDFDKIALDSGRRPELSAQLLQCFDSQISGGKRYDLATFGRRLAHATFHTSHATDRFTGITWAIDLTPLVHDDRFRAEVSARLARFV
jgi:LmbE family N-acetylglucosaminyl deacetylase